MFEVFYPIFQTIVIFIDAGGGHDTFPMTGIITIVLSSYQQCQINVAAQHARSITKGQQQCGNGAFLTTLNNIL